MTDTVPAAAIGLPATTSFDRRSFLATLAAAGVVTPGLAKAAVPCGAADHPDGELLELVAALFAAEAHWDVINARANEAAIFDRCEALMPTVPPALFFQEDRDTFEICHDPKKLSWVDGDREGERRRHYAEERHVPSLRWKIAKWRQHGTGQNLLDRAEEIIAALDAYMAAVERAEDESGVTAFHEESSRNQELIDKLNFDIAAMPARTAEGLAEKARAAGEAWGSPDYVSSTMLPDLLRNEGIFRNFPFQKPLALAISVLVDAMKLEAEPSEHNVAVAA